MAQTPTATVVGRVDDTTGAPVPQAKVRARNLGTNEIREAAAAEDGGFVIAALAPGQYEITVEHPGFKKSVESMVELQVEQQARFEFKLQVGDVAETVEVTESLPLLNTENAARGEVITSAEITEMPLEGRDFTDLAFLVPGVQRRSQGGQGSVMNVNGARADNTNFLIDGFNDQNPRSGTAMARPPLDAMQEFKMQVTGYSAEYGRLAGGAMNMVLKTGTNKLHGTAFEFLRNDAFDARNFFDGPRSKLRRNQFGGTLNGPVVIPKIYNGRNRTFFLGSWESYRQIMGTNRLSRVPTSLERNGDFSQTIDTSTRARVNLRDPLLTGACTSTNAGACFPGNVIPASRWSPIARRIAAFYPVANLPGINNHRANRNDRDYWNSFLAKGDHRFNDKDTLSARYLIRLDDLSNPFNGSDLGTFGNTVSSRHSLGGIGWTRVITPSLINELRLGFQRTVSDQSTLYDGINVNAQLGLPSPSDPRTYAFPRITIRDLAAIGDATGMPLRFAVTNYELANTVTWVKSKHVVKAGGMLMQTRFIQPAFNNVRGTYNFLGRWTNDPYGDFLLGFLNNATRRVAPNDSRLTSYTGALFAQDDYRVSSRLTINLGLRYEIMRPMGERDGKLANFVPSLGKVVISGEQGIPDLQQRLAQVGLTGRVTFARQAGLPETLVFMRHKMFAPRIGIAWRPFGGTATVIRTGYGIFYGNSLSNPVRDDLADTFPFAISETFNRLTTDPLAVTLEQPFPDRRLVVDGATNAAGYDTNARPQYLQSWNFTLERQLSADTALEIAYVGSKGTHLGRRYDVNQPFRNPELRPGGTGAFPRPYVGFNTIQYYNFGGNSTYNAGMVTYRRRVSRGAFFRINYVFSKSIDDASQISGNAAGGYPGAQDSRNLRLERGRSDFDNGHSVLINYTYVLPFTGNFWVKGWQLSGTGRGYTGQPFTPRTSNVQLDQGEANRPDRIAKGRLENAGVNRWFDLSAFPVVPVGAFRLGNSGRNILDGPGFMGFNAGLFRNFTLREKRRESIQFRWEVFNVLNHTNFDLPEVFVNAAQGGTIISAAAPRSMQFALKYIF